MDILHTKEIIKLKAEIAQKKGVDPLEGKLSELRSSRYIRINLLIIGASWALVIATIAMVWASQNQTSLQSSELIKNSEIASAQFILDLGNKLDGSKFDSITAAIQNHNQTYPILKTFGTTKLENYIGQFETIGDLTRDKVINLGMAYDEFGFDVEKAWCNDDVRKDIAYDRSRDPLNSGVNAYFSGFEYLANNFMTIDHYKDCSFLDQQ